MKVDSREERSLKLLEKLQKDASLLPRLKPTLDLLCRVDPSVVEVIEKYHGLSTNEPLTFREIAQHCGVSRGYAHSLYKRGMWKLQGLRWK